MSPRKLWQEIDDAKYLETLRDNVLRGDFRAVTKITPDGTFPSSGKALTAKAIKRRRDKLAYMFRENKDLLAAAHLLPIDKQRSAVHTSTPHMQAHHSSGYFPTRT